MCGRNSLFDAPAVLETRFDAEIVTDGGYEPRYNIAPGDGLYVITNEQPSEIQQFRWGFSLSGTDGPGEQLINARAESVADKAIFTQAWESRPCLVLSSGFYEWKTQTNTTKQPYRIYRENETPFAMAGLWDRFETAETATPCVTILTTEPNEVVEPIHDRMPVVLPEGEEKTWLASGPRTRSELCQPCAEDILTAVEISTRVNNPANDDPSVIEPLGHEQAGLDEFG